MISTIYHIEQQANNVGSAIIRELIKEIIDFSEVYGLTIRPLSIKKDAVYFFEHEHLTIGIMSHENLAHSSEKLLHFMASEKCDLIFCTSALPDEIPQAIQRGELKNIYQTVHLKNIFSPNIRVESLLHYQVDKLSQLIQFSIENSMELGQMNDENLFSPEIQTPAAS